MATENIIVGQNSINARYFNLGKGAFDAKLAVVTKAELNSLIAEVGSFYDDGSLVWVMSERQFYIVNNDGTNITATKFDVGDGGGNIPTIPDTGYVYWGGQQYVYDTLINNDPTKRPSVVGFKNGDLIVASELISLNSFCQKFDTWRVYIDVGIDTYVYEGSIKGEQGPQGPKGDKGDKGEAFQVNGTGLLSDRPACTDPGIFDGYAYLATDDSKIYFAIVPSDGTPCSWSAGAPFGKGNPGRAIYTVFKRSVTPLVSGDQPSDNLKQEEVDKGWFDNVPPEDGNPDTRDLLYMSQATYAVLDESGITDPTVFSWTPPILIEGRDGLDGREGRDAGFWVVWSESHNKPLAPTNLPTKNADGTDSWVSDPDQVIPGTTTPLWFDDIGTDPENDKPRWMAQSLYSNATGKWGPWVITQVGGEKPPYRLNLFARKEFQPGTPTTDIPYTQPDGTFTDGFEAANLVNADLGEDIWSDGPPAAAPNKRLWFTELFVSEEGPNTNWSTPVELDGKEGDEAGIWTIWTNNNATSADSLPPLGSPNDMIDNETDTIDFTGYEEWYDEADTSNAVWMAQTYFRKGLWSAWRKMRVRGEKGDPGVDFKIDAQGPLSDRNNYCNEDVGFSFLDTDASMIYFKTTGPSAAPCDDSWSAGAPFGKGDPGESNFNLYTVAAKDASIVRPDSGKTKEEILAMVPQIWFDAPPSRNFNEALWMTTTSYAVDADGNAIDKASIVWTTPVTIDGHEGVSAGIWTIWSENDAKPSPPKPVKDIISNDGSSLNLDGTAWIDDVGNKSVVWMATSYYRPASQAEIDGGMADSRGWLWTAWQVVKVRGEDGADGADGTPAFTYIPSTIFMKLPATDNSIVGLDAVGGCLTGNTSSGFAINLSGGITIGGTLYGYGSPLSSGAPYWEDGIPQTNNNERVWVLQGVFNSNDHLCTGPNKLNWGPASILKDTAGMDYQYHRGRATATGSNCDAPPAGKPGFKPEIPAEDGDPDSRCWYSDPDKVPGGTYWMAQKDWSKWPDSNWVVYQIRGEDGKDATTPTVPPPSTPQDLIVSRVGFSERASWAPSTPGDPSVTIEHYEVEEFNQGLGVFIGNNLSATIPGIIYDPDYIYKFRVRAVDSLGNKSNWSSIFTYQPIGLFTNPYGHMRPAYTACSDYTVPPTGLADFYFLTEGGKDLVNLTRAYTSPNRTLSNPYPNGSYATNAFYNGSSTSEDLEIQISSGNVLVFGTCP